MKKIIIGGVAVIIGVAGFSNFFFTFLGIIAGILPVILISGGALAFYLGYTDIQAEKDEPEDWAAPVQAPVSDVPADQSEKSTQNVPDEPIAEKAIETASEPKKTTESEQADHPPAVPAFKGNAETQVFHSLSCKFSQGKKCTVEFPTREEAVAQGYKPCKVCKA